METINIYESFYGSVIHENISSYDDSLSCINNRNQTSELSELPIQDRLILISHLCIGRALNTACNIAGAQSNLIVDEFILI